MLMAGMLAGGKLLGLGNLARAATAQSTIDRRAVVRRHNPTIKKFDPFSALTIGNGNFAFTADVTGLQTFAQDCSKIFPLCTCAHWAWHTNPMPPGMRAEDFRFKNYDSHGRMVGYATDKTGQEQLFDYLRENPHRMYLGQIGFDLPVKAGELQNVNQTLDLWTGTIDSRFEIAGKPVGVQTACHPQIDAIAVRIDSSMNLSIRLAFPYPSPEMDMANWDLPKKHHTEVETRGNRAEFVRQLDIDNPEYATYDAYSVTAIWANGIFQRAGDNEFKISNVPTRTLDFVIAFAPTQPKIVTADEIFAASADGWQKFWTRGAAIDLSGSTDNRAHELERRIVLSQYNTAINCAGLMPPPETGLLFNTWYGKSHLEMHWWHGVHFAAWDRFDLLERSLDYYRRIMPVAKATAVRQGYDGVRWPKMVGPDGADSPSPIAPLLIWQQPHPIYYAELSYRRSPTALEKWRDIVFDSADFLASFAALENDRYVLGPPLKPVPENTDTMKTKNPAFELAYCRFALETAQLWRKRLGMSPNQKWADVVNRLSPLPVDDGRYLMMEGMTDTYTNWNWEHPSLLGMYGMQSGDGDLGGVDRETMRRSLKKVMEVWQWDRCWGWDFPMAAMCAAKLGEPEIAVQALMIESVKNKYLPNGHVYQRPNLPAYLPANGGLLSAIAMMVRYGAFPADGKWKVFSEGFSELL
jgi:hypothetical protein